jgi:hypothetical protein
MANRVSKEREAAETRQLGMIQRTRIQMTTQLIAHVILQLISPLTSQKRWLRLPRTSRNAQRHSERAINAVQKRLGAPSSPESSRLPTSMLSVCQYCRCDVLPDTDPPLCAHCKQYNYDCTFFLPIQETRFKKKRAEEDHSHQSSQPRTFAPSTPTDRQEQRSEVRAFGK